MFLRMIPRWRLCEVFGIPLYLDPSLAILLLFFVTGGSSLLSGFVYALLLLASIVAHELGHSLVARRYGCSTRDITLSLLGGCASLESIPRRPSAEFTIAVAGPLVSFACALLAFSLMALMASDGGLSGVVNYAWSAFSGSDIWTMKKMGKIFFYNSQFGSHHFLKVPVDALELFHALLYAGCTNVMLGLFNLLPGFPMDGGRVFRSVMANFTGRAKATYYAMIVGRVFAVALGIMGLYRFMIGRSWGLVTCLIAYMIWQSGYREYLSVLDESDGPFDGWRARVSPPPYGGDGEEVEVRRF